MLYGDQQRRTLVPCRGSVEWCHICVRADRLQTTNLNSELFMKAASNKTTVLQLYRWAKDDFTVQERGNSTRLRSKHSRTLIIQEIYSMRVKAHNRSCGLGSSPDTAVPDLFPAHYPYSYMARTLCLARKLENARCNQVLIVQRYIPSNVRQKHFEMCWGFLTG